jgi:hypothetical protein
MFRATRSVTACADLLIAYGKPTGAAACDCGEISASTAALPVSSCEPCELPSVEGEYCSDNTQVPIMKLAETAPRRDRRPCPHECYTRYYHNQVRSVGLRDKSKDDWTNNLPRLPDSLHGDVVGG